MNKLKNIKKLFNKKTFQWLFIWCPIFAIWWITSKFVKVHEWATDKANEIDDKIADGGL